MTQGFDETLSVKYIMGKPKTASNIMPDFHTFAYVC